ncbi:MAG TPA: sodium:alanine symporter family protein [Bacteroidales bacterium]|nr:sodium:alanine symporter family protein [Bacteroidales bacterium]
MHPILQTIDDAIQSYNNYVGVYAVLAMLVPTGIYFIIRLKFLNVTKLWHSIRVVAGKYDKAGDKGDVSHFKALTTALSATVGTGNIVGVSLAIYFGGPGAIFWMWITGFLGMILKYAECTLSHKFRRFNSDGSVSGGPMYYMEYGLKNKLGKGAKVMAVIFAVATILCSLGTGNMAQANSMTDAIFTSYNVENWLTGIFITSLVLLVIVGGIKRIADVTSFLVPFMAIMYFVAAITVLIVMYDHIPAAFELIFYDAFHGEYAKEAGVLGGLFLAMTWGIRRGLFSNEAGQGSAPIAHAAAKTEYAAREGLVASLEPLVDTLIICTMTALVIIVTGAWQSDIQGVGMTIEGMKLGLGEIGMQTWAEHIVTFGLVLFAFSTVISWSYYGTRAANYLLGEKYIKPYSYLYALFVFLGSIFGIELVWHFVDMVITFMTIPNLIALLLLSGVLVRETNFYFSEMKKLKRS